MAKSLLLISQQPEDLAFAAEVAKVAGLNFIHVPDAQHGIPIIAGQDLKAIFVDASREAIYRPFEAGIQEAIGIFSDRINPNQIHFIASATLEQVPFLTQSPLFGHLILRRPFLAQECADHYGRIVKATLQDKAFGLSSLMKPGTKIQTIKLVASEQKSSAVEAIKNYIIAARFQARMATLIANAIDEILSNAVFDAPTDTLGRPLYATTPRSAAFKLEGRAEVEMQVGFDGTYVGITAIDHFGSLDKSRMLASVSKVYTDEEYRVKGGQYGAGMGLTAVYRTGGSFFFANESRERTEVTIFFKRADSFKEFKQQFRFFSTQFYF